MTSTATRLTYGELRMNAERIYDGRVKERVLAGMELLREKYGDDFADHIDPGSLNLEDGGSCVLGQLYGGAGVCGYVRGLAILDGDLIADEDAAARYGFLVADDEEDYTYEELTDAWLVALGAEE